MNKQVVFAFRGDMLCFMHVLLNVVEMNENGIDCRLVFEGEAVKLVKELEESKNLKYLKLKEDGKIDCICKACSAKFGVLEFNSATGIPMCSEMSGHPSMGRYVEEGFSVITM